MALKPLSLKPQEYDMLLPARPHPLNLSQMVPVTGDKTSKHPKLRDILIQTTTVDNLVPDDVRSQDQQELHQWKMQGGLS